MPMFDLVLLLGVALFVLAMLALSATRAKMQPTPEPTCGGCAHWDREAGAQTMSRYPAFRQAADTVTPAEMAYGYVCDPESGERTGLKGPASAANMQWSDFGSCAAHSELRHKDDTCAQFRLVQIRVKA